MADAKGSGSTPKPATTSSSTSTSTAEADAQAAARIAQPEVAEAAQGEAVEHPVLEEALDKGYLGESTDPTPNEDYTVAGVTKGQR